MFADIKKVVFPLHPILWTAEGPRCACRGWKRCAGPGKHPAVNYGHLELGSPVMLPREGAGVGIKCGAAPKGSDIFVVDCDSAEAEAWLRSKGLPPTLSVLTGSGRGHQYYFQHPGFHVKTSAGILHPQVDIRGDGGFVVAPGSPHKSGGVYRIAVDMTPAVAPDWLLSWLRENQGSGPSRHKGTFKTFFGGKPTGDWLVDHAAEKGWLGRELKPGMFSVQCPNHEEHTVDTESGTVIYVNGPLVCKHGHCAGMKRDHLAFVLGAWMQSLDPLSQEEESMLRDFTDGGELTTEDVETLRKYVEHMEGQFDAVRTELGNVFGALGRLGDRVDEGTRLVKCPCGGEAKISRHGRYRCGSCKLKTKNDVLRALVEVSNE